ncbi:MAG: phage holin family protein [Olsenella sp.]|jgi:putative membrane protein|nr:phage holin family protein [Olsenella sp.]
MRFIGRWLITTIAIMFAIAFVPGIQVVGGEYMGPIMAALALALVNSTVKPIMRVLSLPVTILSLGLFSLVLNALMLELASYLALNIFNAGIVLSGFGAAFWGAIIISIVSSLLGGLTD